MEDSIQFQNMDNYHGSSNKFGLTFKQIILQHINRCVTNGSLEFVGGYWEQRVVSGKGGSHVEKKYVPNSREVFCNSIKMLRAILLGYFNEDMKKKDKELREEFERKKKEAEENEETDKDELNNFKIDWYLKLFEELILLSKHHNFFEEEFGEDEV